MMDDKSQMLFQALLKNALWGTPITKTFEPSVDQWNQIMTCARKQAVTAMIAEAVLRHASLWTLDESLKKKMQMTVIMNIRDNERLNKVLASVTKLLNEHGYRSVLLKGQGVALNYIKPELRCCGDIDLYVGKKNYNEACQLLADCVESLNDATESTKHLHVTYHGESVEIHRVTEDIEGKNFNKYFQTVTLDILEGEELPSHCFHGTQVLLPSDDYNAFYIFEHIWHHFMGGGIGLRQLCDWVRFLHVHNQTINRIQLKEHLKKLGLWYPWVVFASIAVEHLGLPADECPFYNVLYSDDALRIVRLIYREGNFGKFNPMVLKRQNKKKYLSKKFVSFRLHSERFMTIACIFPRETTRRYGHFLNNSLHRVILEMKVKDPEAPYTVRRK
jgi:hypothetical protein